MLFRTSAECKAQAHAHIIEARRARGAEWGALPYGRAHIAANVESAGAYRREALRLAGLGR